MSIESVLLLATALLAVVAVTAAVVAVRAVRRISSTPDTAVAEEAENLPAPVQTPPPSVSLPVRIVEGRVMATPTEQQVVATALGRPGVRLSVYASGLAHALRPESRDRILALMRREYRHRRRTRQRLARRAARAVPPDALRRDDSWLGSGPHTAPEQPRSLPRAVGE